MVNSLSTRCTAAGPCTRHRSAAWGGSAVVFCARAGNKIHFRRLRSRRCTTPLRSKTEKQSWEAKLESSRKTTSRPGPTLLRRKQSRATKLRTTTTSGHGSALRSEAEKHCLEANLGSKTEKQHYFGAEQQSWEAEFGGKTPLELGATPLCYC